MLTKLKDILEIELAHLVIICKMRKEMCQERCSGLRHEHLEG